MMLKWKKKIKGFSSYPTHWEFWDQGPNCLIFPSLVLYCLLIQGWMIFSFHREYQTKLQSRLRNCYPRLPSLPVFSKLGSFCWLYKYKTEPTTALIAHGKMYHHLWTLQEQTHWPGSTGLPWGKWGFWKRQSTQQNSHEKVWENNTGGYVLISW